LASPRLIPVHLPTSPPLPDESPRSRTARRIALAVAILAGLALRIPYGWPDPGPGRNWDERFGLPNVRSILQEGAFRPVNAFHPSLSYLPQTFALAAVDACRCLELGTGTNRVLRPDADARRRRGSASAETGVSALGYRTCRVFQALLGALAQGLLYLLASRVVSRWTAVGLAAVLAFVPWHLWIASLCNEEAGFFVAVEIAALATLAAARRRDATGAALAGLAIGAAFATKLNGGLTALPLALWSALEARRDRRAPLRLILSGLVAAATFAVLNPHFLTRFDMVRRDFGYTVRLYKSKAIAEETSRLDVLLSSLGSPSSPNYLGLALALFAAAGLIAAWLPVSRTRLDPAAIAEIRLLSLFPLSYAAVFAVATPHFNEHNVLYLLPFALVLAGAGVEALRTFAGRALGRNWTLGVAWLAVASGVPVAARGVDFVYRATVPTTAEVALGELAGALDESALVARVRPEDKAWVGREPPRSRWLEIDRGAKAGAAFERARLDRLDGWVLERTDLPPAADLARSGVVRPRLFRARGPELFVAVHPWRRLESGPAVVETTGDDRGLEAEIDFALRADSPATFRSLRFDWIGADAGPRCELRLPDGEAVPVHVQQRRRLKRKPGANSMASVVFSERFPATAASATLACRRSFGNERLGELEVLDWMAPAPEAPVRRGR
jgi:hypothetical protein